VELHRPARQIEGVRLRYHAALVPCKAADVPPAGRHEGLELRLDRAVGAAAPGQVGCLMDGELVVGWGVISDGLTGDE